jgi:hypothetical protein
MGRDMNNRKPLTMRDQWVGACRVFLLMGGFLVGHAVYKFDEYSRYEARSGFKLMLDWSVYVRLYEWGGKRAVVGFISLVAVIFLTVSVLAWRKLRQMPRD